MSPAQVMSALGITQYEMNPPPRRGDFALAKKYSMAAEMMDWEEGPVCNDSECKVPYGVYVGLNNGVPVQVFVSFEKDTVIEIVVKFSEMRWNEMLPIFDQKYGPDWNVKHEDTVVTDYETKKSNLLELIHMEHIGNGTNPRTKDRCKIWATNIDIVFEHKDILGPYHSEFVIQMISKNF
jgi:hypothetical protein